MMAAEMETERAAQKPTSGSEVGTLLRACREKAGYDLDELSRQLRIRRPFLTAIEDGRIQDLPGLTYAMGFVRNYADYFGLDTAEILRRFRAECGGGVGPQALRFPAPVREGSTPKAGMILLGLMIAGVAYGVWYFNSVQDNALVELVYPVPDRLRHLVPGQSPADSPTPAHEAKALPAKPEISGPKPAALSSASETTPVVVTVPVPPRAGGTESSIPGSDEHASAAPPAAAAAVSHPAPPSAAGSEGVAAVTPEPAQPAPMATVASAVAAPAAAEDTAPPPPAAVGGIVLRARSETWLQIRDTQEKSVLLSRILNAGEEFRVPDRPGLVMTTGNAGGLEVTVNGEALPPLGREGAVRRNIALEAGPLRTATGVVN